MRAIAIFVVAAVAACTVHAAGRPEEPGKPVEVGIPPGKPEEPGKPAEVDRVPMARGPKVLSRRVEAGNVVTEYSDGTVATNLLRRIARPPEVHARMQRLVAERDLARAVLESAEIPLDAPDAEQTAALDKAAEKARERGSPVNDALKALGLLAAGAAAGAAATSKKKDTPS